MTGDTTIIITIIITSTPEAREHMRERIRQHDWSIREACRSPYTYEDDFPSHPFVGAIPDGSGPILMTMRIKDYFRNGVDNVVPVFDLADESRATCTGIGDAEIAD